MTTTDKLRAIVERSEKATRGPWEANYGGTKGHVKSVAGYETLATPTVARFDIGTMTISEIEEEHNGEFIADARLTVPVLAKALLAVLERCDTLPYMSDHPHDERTLAVIRETIHDNLKELGE